ncbi:MAG TPA: glycogen/starch synthase [Coleofasciculaceae cyanobacterium]|jgi:glycogen synthase
MAISSVFTANSFQAFPKPSPARYAPKPQMAAVSGASRARVLKFSGQAMAQAGKNVLWTMLECPPVGGGLASVAKFAPAAMASFTDKDFRLITPYYGAFVKEDNRLKAQGKASMTFTTPDGKQIAYPMAFEDTGAEVTLPIFEYGQRIDEKFRLLQKFSPVLDASGNLQPSRQNLNEPMGNWIYAIDNEKYFRRFEKPYIYNNTPQGHEMENIDPDPTRAMAKQILTYTRAVAAFKPLLEEGGAAHAAGNHINKFHGNIDVLMAHDWHAGLLWSELPDSDKTANIFMLHNTYDSPVDDSLADQLDLKVPDYLAKQDVNGAWLQKPGYHSNQLRRLPALGYLSPVVAGIQGADAIIANHNYTRTLTETDLLEGSPLVTPLKKHFQNGTVVDMHHALPGQEFNPSVNPYLKEAEGFQLLKEFTPEALKEFKKANKLALQRKIGLNQDENAVLFFAMPRIDPYQKGSMLILKEVERFMKAPGHEKAQMVLVLTHGKSPLANDLVKKLQDDPELKGRLYLTYDEFTGRDVNVPMYAASDFYLMPSVYEPYGQNQLEACSMGSVTIGHGVDGIRSTVSDPEMRVSGLLPQEPPEKVWEYGQTGILMRPFDSSDYQDALSLEERVISGQEKLKTGGWNQLSLEELKALVTYFFHDKQLPEKDQKTLQQAQDNFSQAMDRAYQLSQDPENLNQVRMNGMKYFREEHNPETIAQKYVQAIDVAMAEKDKRQAGARLSAFA